MQTHDWGIPGASSTKQKTGTSADDCTRCLMDLPPMGVPGDAREAACSACLASADIENCAATKLLRLAKQACPTAGRVPLGGYVKSAGGVRQIRWGARHAPGRRPKCVHLFLFSERPRRQRYVLPQRRQGFVPAPHPRWGESTNGKLPKGSSRGVNNR